MHRLLIVLALLSAVAAAQPPADTAGLGPVMDAAEVSPTLVGGMEALAAEIVYPEEARRDGVEGMVAVQVVVSETGEALAPTVLVSPSPLLAEAALAAIRRVRFTPGRHDGEPVKVRVTVPITFRLTEPAPEPEVFEVVDTPPQLIGGLRALSRRVIYPEGARRAGIEGNVLVQFIVDTDGRVRDAFIFDTDHPALNDAALVAVRGSRFSPGLQDGVAVRVRFTVPITFRLQ